MSTQEFSQVEQQLAQLVDQRPNDPQVLQAVERLINATEGGTGAARLLFRLYLHPDLCDAAKGVATAIIVKTIRRHAELFHPRAMGIDPDTPAFGMIHKGLAHHLDAAIDELDLVARFQHGHLDALNSPKFIVAIPKSGSSMLGLCLGGMVTLSRGGSLDDDPFAFRGYPAWWQVGSTHDWDLRPEIGADPLFKRFPGGVYKGHITPTDKNFAVLGLYEHSRYLVCVRDPRDQIVAAYCDSVRARLRVGDHTVGDRGEDAVRAEVLEYLRGGQLLENLHFVGKWLARRDTDRSLVVTYESLVTEPLGVLRRVADHFALPVSDDQIEQLHARASGITDRVRGEDRSGHDRSIYPLGWTGRPGVWKDYFSPEAEEAFGAALSGFAGACPWAGPILDLYPDLAPAAPNAVSGPGPLRAAG